MTITPEDDLAIVRRIVEAIFNQGALAEADALFTPDYVNHGGLIPDLVHGPEAIKVAVALYRTAFPAFHITIAESWTSWDAEGAVQRWSLMPVPDAADLA